jgi:hypothetical protein
MKARINKDWHEKNRMPKNPTLEERIAWHLAHSENCGCRPIPDKLSEEIRKRRRAQERDERWILQTFF